MAQQTTIAAVIPYFLRWMDTFPTVESLAAADLEEIYALWQGLGYYQRARNLHAGAIQVTENGWPESYEEWLEIKGVGKYTAAAIASICLNEKVAVVDGNVERVYSRVRMDGSLGSTLNQKARNWAQNLVLDDSPGDWNQAIMELGALICRPRNPSCPECPVHAYCQAHLVGASSEYPAPKPKKEIVQLLHYLWIPVLDDRIGIRKIPDGKWWAGMFDFARSDNLKELENLLSGELIEIGTLSHVVTRHKIELKVSAILVQNADPGFLWLTLDELKNFGLPAPSSKALELAIRDLKIGN